MFSQETVKKIVRFIIAGTLGALTQVGALAFFADFLGLWYLLGSVLAFVISITVSFILQKWWTFNHRDNSTIPTQAGLYLANALVNLGLNTAILYLLVDHAGLNHLVAQLVTSALVAILSFFVYNHLIFHHGNPLNHHSLLQRGEDHTPSR